MDKYNPQKIEDKWQKIWASKGIYEPDTKHPQNPFYNLMMFPYPSAEGLHVGNMYAFVGSDIYGRFKRMLGYDVFEPIGLDGFGIHSENYAIKKGVHPMKQAKVSEKRFYKQLSKIGNGFAWNERLETYDPNYYKWTQWIFTKLFNAGLAYRKKQAVNWCPSCKTVLADEQVISGKCERCGSNVVKKDLEQWFFKITKYAERLLNGLNNLDWSDKVKTAQRNWIGKSTGAFIKFKIHKSYGKPIEVFTTRPDTLFGVTYLVLSPESGFISAIKDKIKNWAELEKYIKSSKNKPEEERVKNSKSKTGIELIGVKAVNPANGEKIPIWVADYVLSGYGTGAVMAVPAHDERDFEFARKYNLPIKVVISPLLSSAKSILRKPYTGNGYLINSKEFNGLASEKAKWKIVKFVGGRKAVQYKLRDWLISRQRYWGPPIPMIYCKKCADEIRKGNIKGRTKGEIENPGWIAVPEKNLPVKLPFIKDFRPEGMGLSPLAAHKRFYKTKCPRCGSPAVRETDVSDTFLDSSWYYIRYLNVNNKNHPWDKKIIRKWLPVDMYIGGAEHSVLHLLYVRFLAMALKDLRLLHFSEPFKKFRAHGLLIKEGAKMSKSKGNVINPDEYIRNFGIDAFRMYLMFLAPFEQGGDFRDSGMLGISRFLERVWKFINGMIGKNRFSKTSKNSLIAKLTHSTIKKVGEDIENLKYNTAISAMMILLNNMENNKENVSIDNCKSLLKIMAPFAPYISEELWHRIYELEKKEGKPKGNFTSIHTSKWPKYNPKLIAEDKFKLVIQVNGKVRAVEDAPIGLSSKEAENISLKNKKIRNIIGRRKPKKIIYIPNKIINIVI